MNLKDLFNTAGKPTPYKIDFKQQLKRQLKFLETSCRSYDSGDREESIRIALVLRVLFHDTGKSISLLTHLGLKDTMQVLSTYPKPEPNVKFLCITSFPDDEGNLIPLLGQSYWKELTPAKEWWNQVIMSVGEVLSRKSIILAAANEDGGAHVAHDPSDAAKELIQGTWNYAVNLGGGDFDSKPVRNQHFSMIRQFAYEVLNSPDITNVLAANAEPKSQS